MVWSINLDVSGTLCSNQRNHSHTLSVDFHPLFTVHNIIDLLSLDQRLAWSVAAFNILRTFFINGQVYQNFNVSVNDRCQTNQTVIGSRLTEYQVEVKRSPKSKGCWFEAHW